MKKIYYLTILFCILLTGCSKSAGRTGPDADPPASAASGQHPDTFDTDAETDSSVLPDTKTFIQETEETSEAGTPEHTEPSEETESDELSSLIDEIITPSMTEYERVKAIHDYLVVHVDYDYENLAAGTLPDTAFTKEGALLLHSAVCEGYARAFSYLCAQAGIEEQMVYGTADDGTGVQTHAWNQVCIDGEWYHVDVTWDDPLMNGKVVTDGSNITYEYFLVPDMTLLGNHTASSPEKLHSCTSERYLEENRRLTIEPYLTEPFTFAESDAEIQKAIEDYLSNGVHTFWLICDVTYSNPESRSELVLNQVKDTMTARGEYGQISVETQYGIADYAIIGVTITS